MNSKLKYTILSIIIIIIIVYAFYPVKSNTFQWKNFTDGLNIAKEKDQKILISVYTDWCKWCKKMDKEVYTDENIQNYINHKYIPIKFNAESTEKIKYNEQIFTHSEFVQGFGIDGFPATIFLKSDGEPITVLPGYHDPKEFLKILKFIAEDHYLKMTFDEYLKHSKK